MEKQRGKGLSFAQRIYMPRTVGLGIGSLSVGAALYPLQVPAWVWALSLFQGFAWAHLAYQLSARSHFPYQAERRNLLYDSLSGGFWVAAMQFNPLPSITILSMMTMNNVAAGGLRLLVRGTAAQVVGILVAWGLLGLGFTTQASSAQVYACIPMLTLYPIALGMVCYRLAIKLSEHKRALSALSRTDSLTGLLNHGSWKDLLHLKFHQCQQQGCHATVALIDIDHFKAINDHHGHIVGDSVLRQLSAELKLNLREHDLSGRYGGDEFCVILPDTTDAAAAEVMERLREVLSHYRNAAMPDLRVSLSIGLAAYTPGFRDAATWLDAADKALYAAKRGGRNRIDIAAHPAPPVSPGSVAPGCATP